MRNFRDFAYITLEFRKENPQIAVLLFLMFLKISSSKNAYVLCMNLKGNKRE